MTCLRYFVFLNFDLVWMECLHPICPGFRCLLATAYGVFVCVINTTLRIQFLVKKPTNFFIIGQSLNRVKYLYANKSLARPTFRCNLFDGENISFDASLDIYIYIYIYIYSTNIPPIMIINRIYGHQNLLSL